MTEDKASYLYAFERAFDKLCGGPEIARQWDTGMWCNAHMHYSMGDSAEVGAKKYFDDLMSYETNRAKLGRAVHLLKTMEKEE